MNMAFKPVVRKLPANSRAVQVAKHTLQQVSFMARQRVLNALEVDGYQGLYYSRMQAGRVCSCSHTIQPNRVAALPILNDQGAASTSHLHSLLTSGAFEIRNYAHDQDHLGNTVKTPVPFAEEVFVHEVNADGNVSEPTTIDADETSMGSLNSFCACCYNTGWVGGYNLVGGYRVVLDVLHPKITLSNCLIDIAQHPLSTETWGQQAPELTFTLTLPFYVKGKVHRLQGWRNNDSVDTQWFHVVSNVRTPLTLQNVAALFDGKPHTFVVTGFTRLTHIEIQAAANTSFKFGLPRLSTTADLDRLDTTQPTQLVIGPNIPQVSTWDVVADTVNNKLWRISQASGLKDSTGILYGWETDARIVQTYENLISLFNSRLEKLANVPYEPSPQVVPVLVPPEIVTPMLDDPSFDVTDFVARFNATRTG
jgi:hypothetical protein